MLWGVALSPGRSFSCTIEYDVHLSMAALETRKGHVTGKLQEQSQVILQTDQGQFVVCTLASGILPQQNLNMKLTAGENVTIFSEGKATIHLTGNAILENSVKADGDEGTAALTAENNNVSSKDEPGSDIGSDGEDCWKAVCNSVTDVVVKEEPMDSDGDWVLADEENGRLTPEDSNNGDLCQTKTSPDIKATTEEETNQRNSMTNSKDDAIHEHVNQAKRRRLSSKRRAEREPHVEGSEIHEEGNALRDGCVAFVQYAELTTEHEPSLASCGAVSDHSKGTAMRGPPAAGRQVEDVEDDISTNDLAQSEMCELLKDCDVRTTSPQKRFLNTSTQTDGIYVVQEYLLLPQMENLMETTSTLLNQNKLILDVLGRKTWTHSDKPQNTTPAQTSPSHRSPGYGKLVDGNVRLIVDEGSVPFIDIDKVSYDKLFYCAKTPTSFARQLLPFVFSDTEIQTSNFEGGEVLTSNGLVTKPMLERPRMSALLNQVELEFPGSTLGRTNMVKLRDAVNERCRSTARRKTLQI